MRETTTTTIKSVASSALEPSYFSFYFSPSGMSNGGSSIASQVGHSQCFDDNQLRCRCSLAYCAPAGRYCLPPDPHTIEVKQKMRTNVSPVTRSTEHPHTALLLAPLGMDIPNNGPSTRTSPQIERAAPVIHRALRYLCREHRRKIEEDFFPIW